MISIIAGVILGGVFIAAAIAKLRTPHWSVMALESGTPQAAVVGLPVFEGLLGLALVLHVAPVVIPTVAIVVLFGFTAVLGYRIRTASDAPCNCFGGKSTDPVSSSDIARNLLLIAIAVTALVAR